MASYRPNKRFQQKKLNNKQQRPNKTHISSSRTHSRICVQRSGACGTHANPLQTGAIRFSAQPQSPHKPIVQERRAWPPRRLALPCSSSLFDSEEECGRRCSRRAVEGEGTISPSLPVLNGLMKFRSEEQRRKHSYTVVAVFTRLPACLPVCGGSQYFFMSPCTNLGFVLGLTPSVLCCLDLYEQKQASKITHTDNDAGCRHHRLTAETTG